jgi:multidrug efflux pump subunit AcrA (membrane-fusion protein)
LKHPLSISHLFIIKKQKSRMPTLLENPEDIRLNADRLEMQQMLGNPPSWTLRYGIGVVFSGVMVVLGLAYFIRYPDIIECAAVLVTENPPIRVVAKTGGRIHNLLVHNQESVKEKQILAVIENTANYQQVADLAQKLEGTTAVIAKKTFSETLQLGELQGTYAAFHQAWKDLQYFNQNPLTAERIQQADKQIAHLNAQNKAIAGQITSLEAEHQLEKQRLDRQKQLFTEGVISKEEIEKANIQFMQHRRQLEQLQSTPLSIQSQITQLETQIVELKGGKNDNNATKSLALEETAQKLRSDIRTWQDKYVILAPISGQLVMNKLTNPNQTIGNGEEIFIIIPENTGNKTIIAKAKLPSNNSGKVKLGQTAELRLTDYPFQEYGSLKATVFELSPIAIDNKKETEKEYAVQLQLTDSLTTTARKTIHFKQEMAANARIVTEDRRVTERIFEQFVNLLK